MLLLAALLACALEATASPAVASSPSFAPSSAAKAANPSSSTPSAAPSTAPASPTPAAAGATDTSATDAARTPPKAPPGANFVDGMTPVYSKTGLVYYVLKEGSGATPHFGAVVSVHYTGYLTDGTKFDSSLDRGTPLQFPIGKGKVIKGWDEGVMSMKVGERRQLHIPAALGYGARGAGGVIPPNADLVFDVELVGVK